MKKKIINILLISLISITPLISFSSDGPGEPPGEPDPGSPLGGGAPIGSGLVILMTLGAAYGGKKLYDHYSEKKEDIEE